MWGDFAWKFRLIAKSYYYHSNVIINEALVNFLRAQHLGMSVIADTGKIPRSRISKFKRRL